MVKQRKKIGIFCGYYLPHLGGVERYVDKLSSALSKIGYEVVIVTSQHANLPSIETMKGLRVYRLPIRDLAKARYPIPKRNAEYKKLIRNIEEENLDVFLLNTRFHLTSLVGAKMGKKADKPVLLIEHGTGHFTVNNGVLDYFGKLYEHVLTWRIRRFVDRFCGVSEACNRWLLHYGIVASGVFYNAVDPRDVQLADNVHSKTYLKGEIIISYAGRLIKEKGILNLLEAFKRVQKMHPAAKLRLVIAGDGPLLGYAQREYKDPSIDFLGRIDFTDVVSLLDQTDIFVYPSLYPEGLPTSVLEAGMMGCAVIATPRGGTAEVIKSGTHGIITDGSVRELTAAIGHLAASPTVRKKMAAALKSRIEGVFNWNTTAKAVDKEIKDLV